MMPQDSRWRITAQFGRNQTTITASNQPLADTETADSKQTKTTEDDDKVVGQNANGQNAKLMAWLSSSDCKVIHKWQYYDPNGRGPATYADLKFVGTVGTGGPVKFFLAV